MEIIIGAVIAVLMTFLCMYCYRRGVKDGMSVKAEREPRKMNIPKLKTKEQKKIAKEQKEYEDTVDAITSFGKTLQMSPDEDE